MCMVGMYAPNWAIVVATQAAQTDVECSRRSMRQRAMLAAIATFRLSSADVSLEKSPPPPDEALRGGRRLALHGGYNRLQLQLLQRADPACGLDDAWRETERAPTPPLTLRVRLLYAVP